MEDTYVEDRSGRMEDGNLEAEAEAELRCPVHAMPYSISGLPAFRRAAPAQFTSGSSLYIPPTFCRGRRNIDLLLQPFDSPV